MTSPTRSRHLACMALCAVAAQPVTRSHQRVAPFLRAATLPGAACLSATGNQETPELRAPASAAQPIDVAATFYPLAYMAERIGGPLVEVSCPLPAEVDVASWMPKLAAIQRFQSAELLLANGAGLEAWFRRVSLPRGTRVETSRGFREQWIVRGASDAHSHGPSGAHTHGETDGHTWLDPLLAELQARAVLEALCELRPAHRAEFEQRFETLARDLRDLHARLEDLGPLPAGQTLLASQPAYDYLAQRYGWRLVNLDLEPDGVLDGDHLRQLSDATEARTVRFILWDREPDPRLARGLRERFGLEGLVVSRCEHRPAKTEGGYLDVMRTGIARLQKAFPARDAD